MVFITVSNWIRLNKNFQRQRIQVKILQKCGEYLGIGKFWS